MERSGASQIIAALILGGAVVAGAWMVADAVTATNTTLVAVEESLSDFAADLEEIMEVAAAPTPAAAPPRRGPDPNRVYKLTTDDAPALGPESAAVTIVEFSDFQCPFCSRVYPTLLRLRQEYGDDVRIVFKHMPLGFHAKAPGAHAASEAAKLQGKFWPMHDKLFEGQRLLSDAQYEAWASEIGLDVEQFKRDVASKSVKDRVASDNAEAKKLGVTGTPAFFINGRFLSGAQPFESFKRMVDRELKG
jgi:protein-disulfide isomerase